MENRVVDIGETQRRRPVTTQPVANPVAVAQAGNISDTTMGLVAGLSKFNPALAQHFAEQDQKDGAAGANFARAGGTEEDAKKRGGSFLDGYLRGSGEAAAIADAQELTAAYYENANKTGAGDIEVFISEFYAEKMKGPKPNDTYKAGYDAIFARQAQALREAHGKQLAEDILDKARADALARVDYIANDLIASGKPLDESFLQEFSAITADAKLTGPDKNDVLFSVLSKFSREGRPDVWEVTKKKRVDPNTGAVVPAMYNVPKWKRMIDQEEAIAVRTQVAQQEKAEDAAREDRESRQQEAMMAVFDLAADGDHEGAAKLFDELSRNRSLFTRVDELRNLRQITLDLMESEQEDVLDQAENEWMLRIHSRDADMRDILSAQDLNPKAKRRLLSFYRQVDQEDARQAREARLAKSQIAADKARRWQNPEFKADTDFIKDSLRSTPSMTDLTGAGTEADQAARAAAERMFIAWYAENPDASTLERRKVASQIVKDFREAAVLRKQNDVETMKYPELPYRTAAELLQAYERGIMSKDDFTLFASKIKELKE